MEEIYDLKKFVDEIKDYFGKVLGIQDFEVRISEDIKSPQANLYCIQIPLLYVTHLKKMCELVFSSNLTFVGLGNVSKEMIENKNYKISGLMFSFDDFKKANCIAGQEFKIIPIDPMRLIFSNIISKLMIAFVIFHELGHVRQSNYVNY